jgi:very-short-patch-repair endonuclease
MHGAEDPPADSASQRMGDLSSLRVKRWRKEILFLSLFMPSIIELCRELRQRETPAEKILWFHLRNRKLFEHKFLRQYPICVESSFSKRLYYIPDFYCHKVKLVVEADGPIHQFKKEYDKNRDEVLMALDLKIVRFENDQILNDIQNVLKTIKDNLA